MGAGEGRAEGRCEFGMSILVAGALATIFAISAVDGAARPAHDSAAIDRGRDDALDICAICHVVAPNQRDPPLLQQPTPSFQTIANDPKWTYKSLSRFLATAHWDRNTIPMKMDRYDLPDHEVDDVVLYILSLRTQPATAPVQTPPQAAASGAHDH